MSFLSIILAPQISKVQIYCHFLHFCSQEGNLNEEGNFGAGKEEGEEEGIRMGGNLGQDLVTGWRLRSEEETDYQTDIFL